MAQVVIENPIINSPFDEPTRHFRFNDEGITDEEVIGRRVSSYFVPIAPSKKRNGAGKQAVFDTEWTKDRIEVNKLVNDIRRRVVIWRKGGFIGVTPTTSRLIPYWTDPKPGEKAIFLSERSPSNGDLHCRGGKDSLFENLLSREHMNYTETLSDGTILGDVPGISPGALFHDRQELHDGKLHRGLMNGIAPHGSSIILSGGYPDDEDLGDVIIYTGEGGRDPNTRRQIADQTLDKGNLALAANHLNGIPIRVHRGRKHAPNMPQGFRYRYDGLYRVASYWQQIGLDGFKIWRFQIEKAPVPEDVAHSTQIAPTTKDAPAGKDTPARQPSTVTRVVRDTKVGKWVKRSHDFTCQICGTRLLTPAGAYAETCHIKPLGRPHNGPDAPENTLCLCPNCHVLLDELAIWINSDHSIGGREGLLRVHPDHAISSEFLQYHRRMCGL